MKKRREEEEVPLLFLLLRVVAKTKITRKSWIERGFAPSRVKAGKGALRFEGTAGRAGGEARTAGTAATAATSC